MALYKRPDSKYYWMKFTFDGELVQQSTKCSDKRSATTVESGYRTALALGKIGIKPKEPAPTLKKACDDFLEKVAIERPDKHPTVQRYGFNIKDILKFFGSDTLCDKITSEKIEKFKHHLVKHTSKRTGRKLKPASINHTLFTFRMILNRLVDLDILPKSPARKVKPLANEIKPPRILTFEEQKVYLMACAQPLRDVAVLMIELGLRPSEALSLKRDDISLDENFLQVQKGKTKSARRKLPLSLESRKVLEYRLQIAEGEYLFPNVTVIDLVLQL